MLCRLALAGGATALALTACSGGSNNTTASSTTSSAATSTSAAVTSSSPAVAAGGGGAFCGQAQQFVTQVQAAVEAQAQHQADLGQKLPGLVSELQSVTPPAAIASDWQTALSALQQLAQAFQGVNLSDPQQLQQLEQKVQPIETQLGTAGQHIDDYLRTQCGISIESTASTTG
jgi:hypothetical protein